ncbi:MAG TPA: fumarate hydratase, partial [Spirochaetes bacterium]|nr:fumarate hydratase [Spirochaetota bacterium]
MDFKTPMFELIKDASTNLPRDVIDIMEEMRAKEEADSNAKSVLGTILDNVDLAKVEQLPICQDTGMIFLDIYYPSGFSTLMMRKEI